MTLKKKDTKVFSLKKYFSFYFPDIVFLTHWRFEYQISEKSICSIEVLPKITNYPENTESPLTAHYFPSFNRSSKTTQPSTMADDEEKKRKQAEIERKRAEVRARMEEASKAKKAKKGFMTPERKKKLRLLLRKKAAEELKKEQERKAAERRRIIEERCGKPKLVDEANEEQSKSICKAYQERIVKLENEKFDLEYLVKKKDMEIAELNSQPTLKKVSKYENKFAKLQKKAAEFNFRNQLKVVKKKEFTLEEEDKEPKKSEKAEWQTKK
nr:unnamed protein product [Callosobruchus analis]